jgi:hypothetical protein
MLEAGANIALLLGGALYFLCTYEQRIKRERVLRTVHSIRSLAHIIDMPQLTKDPSRLSDSFKTTTSSPVVDYTALELQRYLDYCSELLAILGKVAALYAQHLYDPVVLDAVDDIEGLTNGMSSKIWQKIIMLERP